MYLVVKADLDPGQQAVQAAHALTEFMLQYHELARDWHGKSNTLAFLAVPDERALGVLLRKARDRLVPTSAFREPDRQNELTALALGPEGKSLVRDLPKALQTHGKTQQPQAHPTG